MRRPPPSPYNSASLSAPVMGPSGQRWSQGAVTPKLREEETELRRTVLIANWWHHLVCGNMFKNDLMSDLQIRLMK